MTMVGVVVVVSSSGSSCHTNMKILTQMWEREKE